MTHTATPWTNDGPDEFGDYAFSGPEDALVIAVVVQNLRDPEVTKNTAEFLGTAVNSHDGLLEALKMVLHSVELTAGEAAIIEAAIKAAR